METRMTIWEEPQAQQFARVLACITDEQLMQAFLRDVMTENEIIEVSARFRAAQMLQSGSTYKEIIRETKLSSRTVARISEWMQSGTGGYSFALELHHEHALPVSD